MPVLEFFQVGTFETILNINTKGRLRIICM